eukprot:TRINITY_DN35517_c0_g1_i1.p1 TRINITY_DN35517_c0_g1~~TRINITY_DN35517_c0_g1_i1.p1  ORF type:complete len:302 (+),score=22.98 TRINITY_DN35517_c0_g1_i1:38-943(+)
MVWSARCGYRRKRVRPTPTYELGGKLVRRCGKGPARYAPCSWVAAERSQCWLRLDEDTAVAVLRYLDVPALGRIAPCALFLRRLGQLDGLWQSLFEALVRERYIAALINDCSFKVRYETALASARRTHLRTGEISQFIWSFRFKREAGSSWQRLDPWWRRSGEALQVRFDTDGRMRSVGPTLLGGPSPNFSWRFKRSSGSRHPTLCKQRPWGSFVQVTGPWGAFPTLVCRRHEPNWGFVLESCWAIYTSFPMPARGAEPLLEMDSEITGDMQQAEIDAYNGEEDEEGDDENSESSESFETD